MEWERGINYDAMERDRERTREMWCSDCKEVVDAKYFYDPDTGYGEWQCPVDDFHTVDEVAFCKCGNSMCDGEEFCDSCKEDIKTKWFNLLASIDPNHRAEDVLDYIEEIMEF